VREETTRQLNRAVVDDWNYQTSFKQKRQEEERLAEMAAAYQEKQVESLWSIPWWCQVLKRKCLFKIDLKYFRNVNINV